MKSPTKSAAAAALGVSIVFASTTWAQDSRPPTVEQSESGVVAARTQERSQSASKLISQDVKNVSGEGLGQVKDIVIDARAGKIVYALVSSGGLLGVGEKIRAVPFAAFKGSPRPDSDLVLDISRPQWNELSSLRDDEIDSLLLETGGRPVFQRFGLDWQEEMKRHHRDAMAAEDTNSDRAPKLMRASELTGQAVTNAGQQVGTIEDLIVDYESRRVSVLLDPDDDYTGTDQKFMISFEQVSRSLDDRKKLTTTLTRSEFSRAAPAQEDWWMVPGGYPYIWASHGTIAGAGYPATSPGANRMIRKEATNPDARDASGRRPIAAVRGALQEDANLAGASREVTIEEQGDTLVLRGTVESRDLKEQIGRQVERFAEGWKVENRLDVRSAVE